MALATQRFERRSRRRQFSNSATATACKFGSRRRGARASIGSSRIGMGSHAPGEGAYERSSATVTSSFIAWNSGVVRLRGRGRSTATSWKTRPGWPRITMIRSDKATASSMSCVTRIRVKRDFSQRAPDGITSGVKSPHVHSPARRRAGARVLRGPAIRKSSTVMGWRS
jgi:hypothetical protein